MSKLIVIVGPTASGKSDLAVLLAKKFNGEVVSADSRQVYKGMDIGTGKIEKQETRDKRQGYFYKNIRHHLLDVASPKRTFTVAQYQKLAWRAIQDIWKRGKLPILCGGTGFYIDTVVNGIVIPEVKPNKKLRKQLEKKTTEELFKQLQTLDPQRAKNIDEHNRRRLIRALEIVLTTKKPVPLPTSEVQPHYMKILKIGITRDKQILQKLIEKRLIKRLKQGMIAEVQKLHKQGISWKRLEEFGLEYKYVAQFLQKKITKEEMIEMLKKEIWHYAKRQMTWFKRDGDIYWIHTPNEALRLILNFKF